MLYEYINEKFDNGEPIFLNEISGYSEGYVRQEMKRLTDEGKVERLYNGVYYLPYTTILGTKGRVSVEKYLNKKYLRSAEGTNGYYTGLQLANMYGFTTQNPACIEIRSNEATTAQRKLDIDGRKVIVYKAYAEITDDNASALRFLDLMSTIDQYSEISGDELKKKLKDFAKKTKVDFKKVKEYLPLYPCKVYKNIYDGGLMNELVSSISQ